LYTFAEDIPAENILLEEFRAVISPDNESWTGDDGKIIGPYNSCFPPSEALLFEWLRSAAARATLFSYE
jgi:hypothetical protein